MKFLLLGFHQQLVLQQSLQNQRNVFITGHGNNRNSIKIYIIILIKIIPQHVINHGLEDSWYVGQTKWHYQVFRVALTVLNMSLTQLLP